MDNSDKVAAAILAAEAARQALELTPPTRRGDFDIPALLIGYYNDFLNKLAKKSAS